MNIFDRAETTLNRWIAAGRARWRVFDHVWRALDRFNEVTAGRLAAAISYYGFFAAFSLTVVVYSILNRVLGSGEGGFVGTVNDYLTNQLNWVKQTADQVGSQQVTIFGLIALVITGVGWIDSLRSSTRAVWLVDEHPGHWIIRWLVDSVMLLVLGLLLGLSLATAGAIDWLLGRAAGPTGTFGSVVLRSSGPLLQLVVNLVLAAAILTIVPRLHLSARRLLPTALIIAVGIQLLNSIGRWYISRLDNRVAYQLVTGTVGLLVYLYLLNHIILFGTALAATSTRGSMRDLSGGAPPPRPGPYGPPRRPSTQDRDAADDHGEPHGQRPPQRR